MLSLSILFLALFLMVGAMNLAWFFQRAAGNSGWIDVYWTFATGAAGMLAALFPFAGLGAPSARQIVAAAIILVWALRLGVYVAGRVATSPEDARYAHFRKDWGVRPISAPSILFVMRPRRLISTLAVRPRSWLRR